MIKSQIYIRKISAEQRRQMQAIQSENKKLKTGPDVLLFALGQYQELKQEVARQKRIVQIKDNKIQRLKEEHGIE